MFLLCFFFVFFFLIALKGISNACILRKDLPLLLLPPLVLNFIGSTKHELVSQVAVIGFYLYTKETAALPQKSKPLALSPSLSLIGHRHDPLPMLAKVKHQWQGQF